MQKKIQQVEIGLASPKQIKEWAERELPNGEIVGGEGNENIIGSEGISRAIRQARLDDQVKAVVLRVNSPGGSALASDVMWREIVLTKKVKPVIVSMAKQNIYLKWKFGEE